MVKSFLFFTVLNPYSDLSPFVGCGRHFWDIWLSPHPESTMRMFNLLKSRLILEVTENPYFRYIMVFFLLVAVVMHYKIH